MLVLSVTVIGPCHLRFVSRKRTWNNQGGGEGPKRSKPPLPIYQQVVCNRVKCCQWD